MGKAMPAFVSVLLLVAVALIPPVAADALDIAVHPSEVTIKPGMSAEYTLTITNNPGYASQYRIDITGGEPNWYVPHYLVKSVPARSSEDVKLVFYPTEWKEGTYDYRVTVQSLLYEQIAKSQDFVLNVLYPTSIDAFSYAEEPGQLKLTLDLKTDAPRDVTAVFELVDAQGKAISRTSVPVSVEQSKRLMAMLPLPDILTAGDYQVRASLEGMPVNASRPLSVQPVRNVVERMEESSSLLSKEVVTYVTNEGNVVENDFVVHQIFSVDPMTGMLTGADNCVYDDHGNRICEYTISQIAPGTTAEVAYRISFLPTYGAYMLLAAVVAALVIFSYARATTPTLTKRHVRHGQGKHHIILELKNPFRHSIMDAVVRDRVTPLARVLHEEIDGVRPVLRSSEAGTELVWSLGAMKPNEHRYLSYKIRPLMEGDLRMPRAMAKLTTEGNKQIKVYSEPVIVE
jgi:hypothetical protein